MQQKFVLRRNPFVVFIYSYAPIIIFGVITVKCIGGFLPDLIHFLYFSVFVFALYRGITSLQKNNNFLVITQNNIALCDIKNKKPHIIKNYSNKAILKIDATSTANTGTLLITTNNSTEKLDIVSVLKPGKQLLLKINSCLYKVFNKKLILNDYGEVEKYIQPNALPENCKENESEITVLAVVYVVFAVIPTWIGLLTTFIMFCHVALFAIKINQSCLRAMIKLIDTIQTVIM